MTSQRPNPLKDLTEPAAWSLRARFLAGALACVIVAFALLAGWVAWALGTRWAWPWFLGLLGIAILFVYLTARWIARSLDRFLERLDGFVEREQAFTSLASHELRTPLAVVQGATEIVVEQTKPCNVSQKALARIQRATAEMSEFIDVLLLLSREHPHGEAGSGRSCDVGDVATRVIEDYREVLGGQPVAVHCDCPSGITVQAPESLVTILVRNLFRNAAAHTTSGSISCEVRGRTLSLRDTGPGIPAAHLAHVFDRNFTTRPGGHGLGLYLSKRICDRYGWRISLESSPGGTSALVTF